MWLLVKLMNVALESVIITVRQMSAEFCQMGELHSEFQDMPGCFRQIQSAETLWELHQPREVSSVLVLFHLWEVSGGLWFPLPSRFGLVWMHTSPS